ncbi:hypothetical protein [Ketobacter alkanivorans]|uniref:DUF2059 domain-containing protein n=1 Tax=Ketobacter alkanivorans TaxID=1917421 RepID=A0A2K9LMH6_9GAMM|nr:hypothetical protein [Ketobacter alkanivorans]AUM13427.1 hypothetical protein Kalk_13790 [Ketobacter alkanivorans]
MRALLIVIALLLPSTILHAQQATPDPAQIQKLIEATGLQNQIQQIPEALRQTAESPNNPASGLISPLITSLIDVFDPKEMLAILSADLIKRLDVPTLLDSMKWYTSSNARIMLEAQTQATRPEAIEKMSAVLLSQTANISEQRKALLQQMSTATQANDIALDMVVNLQAAFMSGLGVIIAPNKPQSFQQLHASFDSSKAPMREQLSKQLLLQQSVAMESVSDDTIKEFLAFANTPSGKKLFTAVRASLDHTVQTVAQRVPQAMQAKAAHTIQPKP